MGNDRSETDKSAKHAEPQQMVANMFKICMKQASTTERLESLNGYVYIKYILLFSHVRITWPWRGENLGGEMQCSLFCYEHIHSIPQCPSLAFVPVSP